MTLPKDIPERVREWAEGEEAREREKEKLVGELSAAMQTHGRDPTPIRQVRGGERAEGGPQRPWREEERRSGFLHLLVLPRPRPPEEPGVIDHQPLGVDR
jgi:hypothetical protein